MTRAGEKLAFALDHFGISPTGLVCADLGCHAGGFTDCLLQRGAARVYAVDTARNILDWNLRTNPRVVVMERTNALHVELPEPPSLVTVDVGWTPQRLIVPCALRLLGPDGAVVSLIKPHYEASEAERRGGRLREEFVEAVVGRVAEGLREVGQVRGPVESPLRGGKGGNREFFVVVLRAQEGEDGVDAQGSG